jgi:AcrR family transcriptional regulator
MDQIAAAAGMAKATLYRRLPSKEQLYISALTWRAAHFSTRIDQLRVIDAPANEALADFGTRLLQAASESDAQRLASLVTVDRWPRMRAARWYLGVALRTATQAVATRLREEAVRLDVDASDSVKWQRLAESLLALWADRTVPGGDDRDERVQRCTELVLASIR